MCLWLFIASWAIAFIVLVIDHALDRTCNWCGQARPTLAHFQTHQEDR